MPLIGSWSVRASTGSSTDRTLNMLCRKGLSPGRHLLCKKSLDVLGEFGEFVDQGVEALVLGVKGLVDSVSGCQNPPIP